MTGVIRVLFALGLVFAPRLGEASVGVPTVKVDLQIYMLSQPSSQIEADKGATGGSGTKMRSYKPSEISVWNVEKERWDQIEVSVGRLSAVYSYLGPSSLTIYWGNTLRRVEIGEVQIPQGASRLLILLIPLNSGADGFTAIPIPFSKDEISGGEGRFLNLSNSDIAGHIGEDTHIIPLRRSVSVDLRKVKDYYLPVQLAVVDDSGAWKVRHSESLIVEPDSGYVFVIYGVPGLRDRYRVLKLEVPNTSLEESSRQPLN